MSRRIALSLSFAITVVISFAVASFASQAGWLQAKAGPTEAAEETMAEPGPSEAPGTQEPIVITEYVYQDIPVVVPQRASGADPAPDAAAVPTLPSQRPEAVAASSTVSAGTSIAFTGSSRAAERALNSDDDDDQGEDMDDDHDDDEDERKAAEHEDHDDDSGHDRREHEHEDDDD